MSAPNQSLLAGVGETPLTPYSLRRMFLLLLRVHYSDPAHYGALSGTLANFKWSSDRKERTIHTDYDYNFNPEHKDLVPAIYIGCSGIIYTAQVVDNQKGFSEDRSRTEYSQDAKTRVSIRHVSKSPDETILLADLSAQFFLGIRRLLQDQVHFKSYHVMGCSDVFVVDKAPAEADRLFGVDLTIDIGFNAVWLILRESHRIKTITYQQGLEGFSSQNT